MLFSILILGLLCASIGFTGYSRFVLDDTSLYPKRDVHRASAAAVAFFIATIGLTVIVVVNAVVERLS